MPFFLSPVFFKLKKNEKKIELGFFITVSCTDGIVEIYDTNLTSHHGGNPVLIFIKKRVMKASANCGMLPNDWFDLTSR